MTASSLASLLLAVGTLTTACSSVSLDPITPGAYNPPCTPDPSPVFTIGVTENRGLDRITSVSGWLLINGESRALQPINAGQLFGTYRYMGPIPYDGEARYRYQINIRREFLFFSSTGTAMAPHDRYIVRPVGDVKWISDRETSPIPDTDLTVAQNLIGPRRMVSMGRALDPGYSGPVTSLAKLTLENRAQNPLTFQQPALSDRMTGGPATGLTVRQSSGSTTYPVTVPAGGTLAFDLSYQGTATGTSAPKLFAHFRIVYGDGIRSCDFGPVWINADFFYNPP